jgi:hypothetical protein
VKIEAINLEDLRKQYERQDGVRQARLLARRLSEPKLKNLLRYHRPHPVEGIEVEQRAAFDVLIEYHSLMEVALIASYVPKEMPRAYVEAALPILDRPAVRAYYEKHYPMLLPQLHRRRLHGDGWNAREKDSRLPAMFVAFSEISRVIHDPDTDVFLWFLEGGSIDDVSLSDLVELIGDSERFADAMMEEKPMNVELAKAPLWESLEADALADPAALVARVRAASNEDIHPVKQALRGFRKFLFFCRDFNRLLATADGMVLTRSGMWHYHAYWFSNMGNRLRPYLQGAIDRFTMWNAVADADADADRSRAADELRQAVNSLTKGTYGKVLSTAAKRSVAAGVELGA